MKHSFKYIFVLITLILLTSLVACTLPAKFIDKVEIDGVEDFVVDEAGKQITFSVPAEATLFDPAVIKLKAGVVLSGTFRDKDCTDKIIGAVPLQSGLNTFYVKLTAEVKAATQPKSAEGDVPPTSDVTEKADSIDTVFEVRITKRASQKAVTSIEIEKWTQNYVVGASYDKKGSVLVRYDDETSRYVDVSDKMLTGFDTATAGEKTVTITYEGKTVTANITVAEAVVGEKVLLSIDTLSGWKTAYLIKDSFATGATVVARYSDKTTETIAVTAAMLTGFDTATAGEKTVTITYEGKTVTASIRVKAVLNPDDITPSTLTDQEVEEFCFNLYKSFSNNARKDLLINNAEAREAFLRAEFYQGLDEYIDAEDMSKISAVIKKIGFDVADLKQLSDNIDALLVNVSDMMHTVIMEDVISSKILEEHITIDVLTEIKSSFGAVVQMFDKTQLAEVMGLVCEWFYQATDAYDGYDIQELLQTAEAMGYSEDVIAALNHAAEMGQNQNKAQMPPKETFIAAGQTIINWLDVIVDIDTAKLHKAMRTVVTLIDDPSSLFAPEGEGKTATVADLTELINFAGDVICKLSDGAYFDQMKNTIEGAELTSPAFMMNGIANIGGSLEYVGRLLQSITVDDVSTILLDVNDLMVYNGGMITEEEQEALTVAGLKLAITLSKVVNKAEAAMPANVKENFKLAVTWAIDNLSPSPEKGEVVYAALRKVIDEACAITDETFDAKRPQLETAVNEFVDLFTYVVNVASVITANVEYRINGNFIAKGSSLQDTIFDAERFQIFDYNSDQDITGNFKASNTEVYLLDSRYRSTLISSSDTDATNYIFNTTGVYELRLNGVDVGGQEWQTFVTIYVYDDNSYQYFNWDKIGQPNINVEIGAEITAANISFDDFMFVSANRERKAVYTVLYNGQGTFVYNTSARGEFIGFYMADCGIMGTIAIPFHYTVGGGLIQSSSVYIPTQEVGQPFNEGDADGVSLTEQNVTELDLTTAGVQLVTVTFTYEGIEYEFKKYVLVLAPEWKTEIARLYFNTSYTVGNAESIGMYLMGDGSSARTVAQWNQWFADQNMGIVLSLSGFSTEVPQYGTATLTIKDGDKTLYEYQHEYQVMPESPTFGYQGAGVYLNDGGQPDTFPLTLNGTAYESEQLFLDAIKALYGDVLDFVNCQPLGISDSGEYYRYVVEVGIKQRNPNHKTPFRSYTIDVPIISMIDGTITVTPKASYTTEDAEFRFDIRFTDIPGTTKEFSLQDTTAEEVVRLMYEQNLYQLSGKRVEVNINGFTPGQVGSQNVSIEILINGSSVCYYDFGQIEVVAAP